MRFEFMKAHSKEFPVEKMATILGVSRCGYYEFLGRKCSKRALENQKLASEIKEVHKQSRGLYGSPRIHAELKKRGANCSRKKVASLMKQEKIQAKMRKKWKRTTQQSKKVVVIARRFLKLSERPPSVSGKIPDGKSGHVTLDLPVRNRTKHVWSFWSELGRKFSAARRAHSRTAKSRYANRRTSCLSDVLVLYALHRFT
jgi:hypothetical protein